MAAVLNIAHNGLTDNKLQMDKALRDRIVESLLGTPLVNNAFRGTLVEAILANALEPEWRWCADGWGSYDFEQDGPIGLEVKQSSARQTWHREGDNPSRGSFDIATRKGRWDTDGAWEDAVGRFASVYVFAWHPEIDVRRADHRDPEQWEFYAVRSDRLPDQKTISLGGVRNLANATKIDGIRDAVSQELGGL